MKSYFTILCYIVSRSTLLCLVLIINFNSHLQAQSEFDQEIICNSICKTDSVLFFQEIRPDSSLNENSVNNTNLSGPYFDHYPGIRIDILTALNYYPELAHIRIQFLYKPIHQTMNARPSAGNIFRKKSNRQYCIIVNNNEGKQKGLSFEELSFTIKIGWIGHELAHICEYERMSNWQTFCFAVKYLCSKKYVRKVERKTDLITIEHNLAYPLYAGTDFLLHNKEIGDKYRRYALSNSLSPEEIKCLWCKLRDGKK